MRGETNESEKKKKEMNAMKKYEVKQYGLFICLMASQPLKVIKIQILNDL